MPPFLSSNRVKRFALLGCVLGLVWTVRAGPTVQKISLFTAGDAGYAAYRIPAIVVTPQQTVLVAAEGRKNDRGDWGLIDLFVRRSLDSGRTWEPARPLVTQQDLPADIRWNPATTGKAERPPGF